MGPLFTITVKNGPCLNFTIAEHTRIGRGRDARGDFSAKGRRASDPHNRSRDTHDGMVR
jgi:hypothetical protein